MPVSTCTTRSDNRSLGVDFSITEDGRNVALRFEGSWERPATGIDTRMKYARLIEAFERRGGRVSYRTATLDDLEDLTEQGETVFAATGKGGLGTAFPLDEQRTVYDRPQRDLMLLLLRDSSRSGPSSSRRSRSCSIPRPVSCSGRRTCTSPTSRFTCS